MNTHSTIQALKTKIAKLEKKAARFKKIEEALRESEEKFKTIFENVNDEIIYTTLDGTMVDMNDKVEDIFGYKKEELIGKNIGEISTILSPKTLKKVKSLSSIAAESPGGSGTLEVEAFHKDGMPIVIEVNAKVMEKNGKVTGALSIVRDITERKKVEAALQESRAMSRALLDATTDSVMLLDAEGIILALNKSYAKKFDKDINTTLGLCLWELLSPEIRKEKKKKFDQVFRTGKPVRFEEEYQGLWFDNIVYPVLDKKSRVSSAAVFSHDITERKQAEKMLRNHSNQLEELVKERTANLEEANAALKVLLKQRDEDKTTIEEKMLLNVKKLVLPYIQKIRKTRLTERQETYFEIVESNLSDIISPFIREISSKYMNLTPMEIQVADLIKQGKTSKEIADMLNMSYKTINTHRHNIRSKIGIKNKKANLRTFLLSLK